MKILLGDQYSDGTGSASFNTSWSYQIIHEFEVSQMAYSAFTTTGIQRCCDTAFSLIFAFTWLIDYSGT